MIELKEYQAKAVKELKEKLKDALSLSETRQKIVFKSPTGSGKTIMTNFVLDGLHKELQDNNEDVAFIWIAPNKLHLQSYQSMNKFFDSSHNLNPVMFEDVDTSEGLNSGDVLFLNWESINKENAILIRDNEQCRNLGELVRRTKENGCKLVAVIDEEHMYGGNNAPKSEAVLASIEPKVELRISATPITSNCPLIEVPRERVIEAEMIKKGIQLNPHVASNQNENLTVEQQLIDIALRKRDELAELYKEYGINPLLLIQLPNDSKDTLDANEKAMVENIRAYLKVYKGKTTDNGKLAVWLSGVRENVTGIEEKNSIVDVLLFKQAIALGWDCPRASVLLIFRDLKSPTFTVQTVGRILRMPEQCHYQNDILNYGYVYTNLSADMIRVVKDDMSYMSTYYAKRREDIKENICLQSVSQERRKTPHVLKSKFKQYFKEEVSFEWSIPKIQMAINWNDEDDARDDDEGGCDFSTNRQKAAKHGIVTDIPHIMVAIPKDIYIKGTEEEIRVDDKARFARTLNELKLTFAHFCRQNVGDYEPGQSAEMIRSAIYEFFEEYLGLGENEAIKIVLYEKNEPKFRGYIEKARNRYSVEYEKMEAERDAEKYNEFTWSLPDVRIYNTEVSRECPDIKYHALLPFFEEKQCSQPEQDFSKMLDSHKDVLDWWYKNGDKGKMHFAVKYTDRMGVPRCFYVDYIVHDKNGKTYLFDTKTKGSDPDAVEKHNALIDYIERENKNEGSNLTGSIVIFDNGNWHYSTKKIQNTTDLINWNILDLNA